MHSSFLNIHDMVLVLTLGECLFLAALLWVLPAQRIQPRRLLAFFSLLIAAGLGATIVVWNPDLQTLAVNRTILPPVLLVCASLLQGPALYFYLRSLSHNVLLIQWKNLLHLLPTIMSVLLISVFGITGTDWLPWAELSHFGNQARKLIWAMMHSLPLFYVLACFWLEYQLRDNLKQQYSTINSTDLKLASWVLVGFLIPLLWSFFAYFLGGQLSQKMNDWMGIANIYLIVLQVNGLYLFGFMSTRELLLVNTDIPKKNFSTRDVSLDEEKIKIIERAIHEQKIYLESNINLERFAELIAMKPRDLSRVINTHFKLNFFD